MTVTADRCTHNAMFDMRDLLLTQTMLRTQKCFYFGANLPLNVLFFFNIFYFSISLFIIIINIWFLPAFYITSTILSCHILFLQETFPIIVLTVFLLLFLVNWLDHSKTLREQNIDPNEILLLRRKFFYSDQNVDARDPVQLNLLYVQVSHISPRASYETIFNS